MKKIWKLLKIKLIKLLKKNNDIDFLNIINDDNKKKFQFVADCQPGINTPNTFISSVSDSHLDNAAELVAGLFYLKDDNEKLLVEIFRLWRLDKTKKLFFIKN